MSDTGTSLEQRINREAAGAITIQPHSGGMASFSIQPRSMGDVLEFAKLLAISGPCIPKEFRNNPGSCLAIVLQALKWGADPYAVANKAFIVNDRVGYEAQLVNAIINSSTMLAKRLDCVFDGEGARRRCRVVGFIKGEADPREYISPEVGAIPIKNSPLWKGDPDQQLFYYSTRAWARRWLPEVLLGIYTPEELVPAVELRPVEAPAKPDAKTQLERFEERHAAAAEPPATVPDPGGAAVPYDPDTGELFDTPTNGDPLWRAEFASLLPKPAEDGEGTDWDTYAQAICWMISKASKTDLAAMDVAQHPQLRRLRDESIDHYRAVTTAIAARAREHQSESSDYHRMIAARAKKRELAAGGEVPP